MEIHELRVVDYMTADPITVKPENSFQDAVSVMANKGIGNLIVTDKDGPKGILTEREILQYVVLNRAIPDKPVKNVLLQSFTRVTPSTTVLVAARTMISNKARLLVFDNDRLVGIITASDLVRAFRKTGKNPSLEGVGTMRVFKLPYDDTVFGACKMMHEKRIGSVVVTRDESHYGIFTERDLLVKVLLKHVDLQEKLGDYCTSPLITTLFGIHAKDAATVMSDNKIKRLPLMKEGKLVAMVTARDLVEAFQKEQ
ncbi:MAG: CBS domain-containing protein [Nitrososphaerales archaeon]